MSPSLFSIFLSHSTDTPSVCILCWIVQYIMHHFLLSNVLMCECNWLDWCVLQIYLPKVDVRMFTCVHVCFPGWLPGLMQTLFLPLPPHCQIHSYIMSIVTSFTAEYTMTSHSTKHPSPLLFLQKAGVDVTLTRCI